MYHPSLHLHNMTKPDFTLLRSGFDTVELAYRAALPDAFLDALADAKIQAVKSRKPHPIEYAGQTFLVEGTGGQGGYAYRISTGPFGAIMKFREKGSNDAWGAHVKLRAYGLATKGILKAKAEADAFLLAVGGVFDPDDTRVGRVDYAMDFFAPNLVLNASEFVAHAKMSKTELIEKTGNGDICNYLRIGKMPGKQICIYDKTKSVTETKDKIWFSIFEKEKKEKGLKNKGEKEISDIWRIEFRAGRDFLKKHLPLRRWDRFLAISNKVFLSLARAVAWRIPGSDTNRSRWALHPIWEAVIAHLAEMNPLAEGKPISPEVLKLLREEYRAVLEAQVEGLLVTLAAFEGVSAGRLERSLDRAFDRTKRSISMRENLSDELAVRAARISMMFGGQ